MKLSLVLTTILLFVGAEGNGRRIRAYDRDTKKKENSKSKPQGASNVQQLSTAGCSNPAECCGTTSKPFDVLVVGLGWAGTLVLKELQKYKKFLGCPLSSKNDCSFTTVGLEHEDHVGGRAIAAELVSGGGNPITEFMFEHFSQNPNAPTKKDPRPYLLYTAHKWSDIHFVNRDGSSIPSSIVNSAIHDWNNAFECLQRESDKFSNREKSQEAILNSCSPPWVQGSLSKLEKLLQWYELYWEFLHSPLNSNGFGNLPDPTYVGEYQDRDYFISAEGNSAKILDAVMKADVEDYETTTDIVRLNTTVTQINWDANPIEVTVVDADNSYPQPCTTGLYYARRVVVTASVGMLKKFMEDPPTLPAPFDSPFFVPALPGPVGSIPGKKEALDRTFFWQEDTAGTTPYRDDMGLYKKLTVQFAEDTWNELIRQNTPNNEFSFVVPEPATTYTNPQIDGNEIFCSLWQHLDRYQKEFFDKSRASVCTLVTREFEAATDPSTMILDDITANEIIRKNLLEGVLGLSPADIANVYGNGMAIPRCVRKIAPGPLKLYPPTSIPNQPWGIYQEDPDSPSSWDADLKNANCVYQIFDGPELNFVNGKPTKNLWNGAWPNFMTGFTEEEYNCTRANLNRSAATCEEGSDPILLFAGDAFCWRFSAFQHGSVQSGIQTANKIIEAELEGDPRLDNWRKNFKTDEFCDDDSPAGGPGNYRTSKAMP